MVYKRFKRYLKRRRFGRGRRFRRGRLGFRGLRSAIRKNKRYGPMMRYNPIQMRPRIVKVIYVYDKYGLKIAAGAGQDLSTAVNLQWRCNNPQDPNCGTASGSGSSGENVQSHSMSYWATYYSRYQVLRAHCTTYVSECATTDNANLDKTSRLVFQLRAKPAASTTSTNYEDNMFKSYCDTKFLPSYNPNMNHSVKLSMSYDYKSMHGHYADVDFHTFGESSALGDQDVFELAYGKQSRVNVEASKYTQDFNIHTRIVYTVMLMEPKEQNTTFIEAAAWTGSTSKAEAAPLPKLQLADEGPMVESDPCGSCNGDDIRQCEEECC